MINQKIFIVVITILICFDQYTSVFRMGNKSKKDGNSEINLFDRVQLINPKNSIVKKMDLSKDSQNLEKNLSIFKKSIKASSSIAKADKKITFKGTETEKIVKEEVLLLNTPKRFQNKDGESQMVKKKKDSPVKKEPVKKDSPVLKKIQEDPKEKKVENKVVNTLLKKSGGDPNFAEKMAAAWKNKKKVDLKAPTNVRMKRFINENIQEHIGENKVPNHEKIYIPSDQKQKPPNEEIKKNTDEFVIVWELGVLQKSLSEKGQDDKFSYIRDMIKKANSILRRYIRIKKGEFGEIILPKKSYRDFFIRKPAKYEGHLVMVVTLVDNEDDVLASSNYLFQHEDSKRSYVGVLEINLFNLVEQDASETTRQRYVFTLVHEVLHTIAFNHSRQDEIFYQKKDTLIPQHLKPIKETKSKVFDEGHWNESYIPNDIMTPITRNNQILSIYSLEFIEHYSPSYSILKEHLPNNFFLDSIDNTKEFFNYQCTREEEKPKYSAFCSKDNFEIDSWSGCTGDYLHRTVCEDAELSNNCYLNKPYKYGSCMDSTEKKHSYEEYGINSRCVETTLNYSMCLSFRVDNQRVFFTYKKNEYECKDSFQNVKVGRGRKKTKPNENTNEVLPLNVICPDVQKFVDYYNKTNCKENCYGNGFCSDGKCVCYDGFDENSQCKDQKDVSKENAVFTFLLGR